jgi:trigger factor
MQSSLTSTSGLERRLEIAVPVERIDSEVDARLKRLSKTAKLKGFRPGKVPFSVVKSQYSGQVHAEALQDLMQSSYAEAVDQQKLRPAGGPRIEPISMAPGAELRYTAVFEVLPEVVLAPLNTLHIERPTAAIDAADIEAMLESMRKQRPVYTATERASKAGDRVTVDYEGRIDGEVFAGGKGEGLQAVLGAGNILKELDDSLHGATVGETKRVAARFPDDYGAKAVAGKEAVFDLNVTAVEASSLPELNDEFAVQMGVAEGGMVKLREEVRAALERELAEAIRTRVRNLLLDAIFKAHPIEVPKVMVDEQVRELQVQMMRRLRVPDTTQLPPAEPYVEPARKRVTLGLVIGEIVRTQSMKVDRERVEARLATVVAGSQDPEGLRRQYLQSREAMSQLESAALEDQALDWALEQVQVTEKASSFKELTGYGGDAGSIA